MSKHHIQPDYSIAMSRLTRYETAEPVSRDQILRRERGQGNIHFPRSANHEQDWQPYPVDPYSCYMCDHTYEQFSYCIYLCLQPAPALISLLILHTQAESGAYSRDFSCFPRRHPFIYTANRRRIGRHATAYLWCSLPRVCRHTERVVLKVVPVAGAAFSGTTMDQLPSLFSRSREELATV